jgi:hypothetical protein
MRDTRGHAGRRMRWLSVAAAAAAIALPAWMLRLGRKPVNRANDAMFAAEAAERAWRLARTPEIAWNRALAR